MYQKPTSSNPRFSFYYLHSYVWCIEWCAAFHTTLLPLLNKMSSMSHPEHTVISLSYLIAFIVTWHTYTHTHTHTAGAVLCSVQEWVPAPRVCFNDNKHRFPERSPLVKNKRLQKTFFFSPRFFSFSFMKSPTWHWDKQTITFNYWQFMVGGGRKKMKEKKRDKRETDRLTFWQAIKHKKTNGTNYNWCGLGWSVLLMQGLLLIFNFFFLQLCLYSDSLPCLFSDCERAAIRVYKSTITLIRTEVFHRSNRAALLMICPTQNQIKALSTCL